MAQIVHLIYNHRRSQEPYNQTAIKKAKAEFLALLPTDTTVYETESCNNEPNRFFVETEHIFVEHTCCFSADQKQQLAAALSKTVAKRAADRQLDVTVTFRSIAREDFYSFAAK